MSNDNRYIGWIEHQSNRRRSRPKAPPLSTPRQGYYVTIWRGGKRVFQKWFSVKKHGTKEKALLAARRARNKALKELDA